jgi:hypothetical protein
VRDIVPRWHIRFQKRGANCTCECTEGVGPYTELGFARRSGNLRAFASKMFPRPAIVATLPKQHFRKSRPGFFKYRRTGSA